MIAYLLLFGAVMAGGLAAFRITGKNREGSNYKLSLVFSGAYLFAITVTHLLPELYSEPSQAARTGFLILAGFFLQQILEFISQGVEHGHIHVHREGHAHRFSNGMWVLVALSFHAVLEGTMLNRAGTTTSTDPLLWGVLLHKAPEAFALISVLACEMSRRQALALLLLFALASPVGLWLNQFMTGAGFWSPSFLHGLFAVVCGSFLHISTTIVFESSSDHRFNARKLAVAILGAAVALAADSLL